jgi:dihydroorotate dehydrogenase
MPDTSISETTFLIALLRNLDAALGRIKAPAARREGKELVQRQQREIGAENAESLRVAIEHFCHVHDLSDVLVESGIVHPYNYRRPFPQEAPQGPIPESPAVEFPRTWNVLGRQIGFPIGVPASVLTSTSTWVRYFANQGFNVLTYKTVRSKATREYDLPNWVFLNGLDSPMSLQTDPHKLVAYGDESTYLRHLRAFSTANSFGVPSLDPSEWREDFQRALEAVGEDKLLILSIMGSSAPDDPFDVLRKDFGKVAEEALKTGAHALEINLSCPNTRGGGSGVKAPLCLNLENTVDVVREVADVVGGQIPIVAKLSYLDYDRLEELVGRIHPEVDGISGINTLQVKVQDRAGKPTFGPERSEAGLSGIAIRHFALDFVRSLQVLRQKNHFSFDIIGMGGVMTAADVQAMQWVGADAVQTATAASINPRLPRELAQVGPLASAIDPSGRSAATIREHLYREDGCFRSAEELGERLGLDRNLVERELNPAGSLDLPRRVLELLALEEKQKTTRTELGSRAKSMADSDMWGTKPSLEEIAQMDLTDETELAAAYERLAEESLLPGEAAAAMNLSVADVESLIRTGTLVSFTWDEKELIPRWQISPDGDLLPGIAELNRTFGYNTLSMSTWVLSPNPQLRGDVPRDHLQNADLASVLAALGAIGAAAH